MRRFGTIVFLALFAAGILGARSAMQPADPPQGEKKLIDLKSDLMGPVAPGDSVIFLVGNFAAQHNGAVITCDSAVRYSDMRIEFFGNVLINKNTTYIYGDRAEYDGERNEARVYSDIVKVIDGDATLYTYDFIFNTKSNVGRFDQGGVLTNRENLLEAVRGYYYADTKELVAVDQVEMRNDEYDLRGDSVVYNMATDNAYFFKRTNIWNRDGDYLYADRGSYEKLDTLYIVTRNGYLLTEKQEMWSDSIDFYRMRNHVILRRDVQIDDTEHKVLAFGDYGEYWKEPGNAFLTRDPSIVSYDLSQGDSLFMRADSMFLYTIDKEAERRAAERARADSAARAAGLLPAADSTVLLPGAEVGAEVGAEAGADPGTEAGVSLPDGAADSLRPVASPAAGNAGERPGGRVEQSSAERRPASALKGLDSLARSASPVMPDSLAAAADSLRQPVVNPLDTLVGDARKAFLKEQARKEKEKEKKAKAEERRKLLDEIAAKRQEKRKALLLAQKEREEKRLAAQRVKLESKMKARAARAARKGKLIAIDSTQLRMLDSLIERNMREMDSLLLQVTDSLLQPPKTLRQDSLGGADSLPGDSLYRLMKGYRNVRIFRSDFQAVCDSMTSISSDSTIHLYINPVLWNQSNQITAEWFDIYTERQQIARAECMNNPLMASQLDTLHYNQVTGKQMTAWFRNNEIYRNDVNGNVQTIYYMQDGEPPVVTDVAFIESGDCSFYIEQKQVVQITYRKEPVWHIVPLDKLEPDRKLFLEGFKWEEERRPVQDDVFDRRVRPSLREAKMQLQRPDFPLQQALEERKRILVESGRWADRTDQVDAATVEWMRQLGYEVGQPRESGPQL